VSTLLPGRPSTRSRLWIGTALVAAASLLNLIPFGIGPLEPIWPSAILWASCGWANQGPNAVISALLFGLGLWLDILTGGPFGVWAMIGLVAHGLTIFSARFSVSIASTMRGRAAITGFFFFLAALAFGIFRGNGINLFAILMPILTAVAFYPYVAQWFDLSEDEA
jgi:rod shape-determining protein MreD